MKKMDLDPNNRNRVNKDVQKERIICMFNCMLSVVIRTRFRRGINIEA